MYSKKEIAQEILQAAKMRKKLLMITPVIYKNIPLMYQKIIFKALGLDENSTSFFWVLMIVATITFGGFWFFQGNVMIVLGLLYLIGFLLLALFRIDFALYLVIFAVMLFDQYEIPGFRSLTNEAYFFNNLKEIPYVPYFDAAVLNPLEMHLLVLLFSLFIRIAVMKHFSLNSIPVLIPFFIFVGIFLFSCINGLRQGGDFLVALWEVRALFYLIFLYLIVPQIVHSKEQIQRFIWVVILGITIKAFQGIWKFMSLGFTTGGNATLTNHEDPVFMVTLLILLFGFLVYKSWNKQMGVLLLLFIPYMLMLAFYVAQHRAAYASFMVLLPGVVRLKFFKGIFPVLGCLGIYSLIFWNSNSILARQVQTIKSGFVKPEMETNIDDYYSDLYREYENYHLAATVRNNPDLGVGFGNKYEQPIPLVAISYQLRDYIPHDEIFWVIVKMGTVGFFAFWFFFNSVAAKGVHIFSQLHDPYLKPVTFFVIIAIINQMVVSYFDLQLTYYRNMVYLGCLLGLLPALEEAALKEKSSDVNNKKRNQAMAPFSSHCRWHRAIRLSPLQEVIDKISEKEEFDLIHCEFPDMAFHKFNSNSIKVMDAHNVEYDNLRRMAKVKNNPHRGFYYRHESEKLKWDEIVICKQQDAIFTTSERDKELFQKDVSGVPKFVISNGVDLDYMKTSGAEPEKHSLVFVGVMTYVPNYDGILWFLNEIFPRIISQIPVAKIYIVGKNPPASIKNRANSNVIVTGYVGDVRPFIEKSSVYVVPLRRVGGTHLKIMEALAMKRLIVTSKIGCEGIDVKDRESIIIADHPQVFADSVIELMRDQELVNRLTRNGYELVREQYGWDFIGKKLDEAYKMLRGMCPFQDTSTANKKRDNLYAFAEFKL